MSASDTDISASCRLFLVPADSEGGYTCYLLYRLEVPVMLGACLAHRIHVDLMETSRRSHLLASLDADDVAVNAQVARDNGRPSDHRVAVEDVLPTPRHLADDSALVVLDAGTRR